MRHAGLDIRSEETWAVVDHMAKVLTTDTGFPEEESDGEDDRGNAISEEWERSFSVLRKEEEEGREKI
ncbi:hypothetical protein L1987_74246 [Smallanthus sonchifolius]|uniref:Uncharacterized protein n=1 Tax=Smallanthus sonchifolius TaxID=185202 RepID=A0ACB9A347_9ASTR|nr:hypothetical protein L1987_74246 [Smallanthus sonchifolius]